MSTFNMKTEKAKLAAVINGVQAKFPAKTSVQLVGKAWTSKTMIQAFSAAQAAMQAVLDTRALLLGQLQDQKAALAVARELYMALERYLEGAWGKRSSVLAQYGFSVKQPQVKSAAKNAVASEKGKLTRKARHTMGRRQKKAVTVEGQLGLQLVGPDGKPIPGATLGPTPPAASGNTSGK